MKGGIALAGLLSCAVLSTAAGAVAPELASTPYQGIVDRNVFALKPPPPPEPVETPKTPPPKITLTGIATLLGNKQKQAYLSVNLPGKPPELYALTEGQGKDDIQVVAIDETGGTVQVKNHGVDQLLDFVNDGAKSVPAAPAPGFVVRPAGMSGVTPLPAATAAGNTLPAVAPPAIRQIPTRTLRLPPANPSPTPQP